MFIVGFERCMTTSLSAYLVDTGACKLLVDGIKEPGVFSDDSKLANEIVARDARKDGHGWSLDASVSYIHDRGALSAIAAIVDDYKVIVCMRNQLRRTVSAYKLYRGYYTRPSSDEWLRDPFCEPKYGDAETRARLSRDALAPHYLFRPAIGKFGYTNIRVNAAPELIDDRLVMACDAQLEMLLTQSLPQRVIYELRYLQRHKCFPAATILGNSYYCEGVQNVLQTFDRERVLLLSVGDLASAGLLGSTIRRFLDLPGEWEGNAVPHLHGADIFGVAIEDKDIVHADSMLSASLLRDSECVRRLAGHEQRLDLYSAELPQKST